MKFKEVYERKFMRLGSKSKNKFLLSLDIKNQNIQNQRKLKPHLRKIFKQW